VQYKGKDYLPDKDTLISPVTLCGSD